MNRSLATLNAVDLVPYRTMINEGIVPMVMVTHILNPQLDPNLPTSLSPNVVTGLLRKQLNFQGVIISDTLWMGGISNTYSLAQAAVLAVKAGDRPVAWSARPGRYAAYDLWLTPGRDERPDLTGPDRCFRNPYSDNETPLQSASS